MTVRRHPLSDQCRPRLIFAARDVYSSTRVSRVTVGLTERTDGGFFLCRGRIATLWKGRAAAVGAAGTGRERRLMETWRSYFPITNFVLQALRKKRIEDESADFSRAEGVLFNACEFWAAVAARRLAPYLGSRSVPGLLVAFEAFSEIGAVRVASALRILLVSCPKIPSPKWLQQQALELETRLLDTEDPIDQLIAGYASEHLTDHLSERQQTVSIPVPGPTESSN